MQRPYSFPCWKNKLRPTNPALVADANKRPGRWLFVFSLPLASCRWGDNWQLQQPMPGLALPRFHTGGSSVSRIQTLLPPSKLGGELGRNDQACSRQLLPPSGRARTEGLSSRRRICMGTHHFVIEILDTGWQPVSTYRLRQQTGVFGDESLPLYRNALHFHGLDIRCSLNACCRCHFNCCGSWHFGNRSFDAKQDDVQRW